MAVEAESSPVLVKPAAGELALFSRLVLVAPAYVKRDKSVLAVAWLPDLVRLGILEEHLGS